MGMSGVTIRSVGEEEEQAAENCLTKVQIVTSLGEKETSAAFPSNLSREKF